MFLKNQPVYGGRKSSLAAPAHLYKSGSPCCFTVALLDFQYVWMGSGQYAPTNFSYFLRTNI